MAKKKKAKSSKRKGSKLSLKKKFKGKLSKTGLKATKGKSKTPKVKPVDSITGEIQNLILPVSHRPAITHILPAQAQANQKLVIGIKHHHPDASQINAFFNGMPAPLTARKDDLIQVVTPPGILDHAQIQVSSAGIQSNTLDVPVHPQIKQEAPDRYGTQVIEVTGTLMPTYVRAKPRTRLLPQKPQFVETKWYNGINFMVLTLGSIGHEFIEWQLSVVGADTWIPFQELMMETEYIHPPHPAAGEPGFRPFMVLVPIHELSGGTDPEMERHYAFFRNGKWWRVIDPNKKDPYAPETVDINTASANPNFKLEAKEAADLNERFFFAGWNKTWTGLPPVEQPQFQILYQSLLYTNGVAREELELLLSIFRARGKGNSWDVIWNSKGDQILKMVLFTGVTVVGTPLMGRFLKRIYKDKIVRQISHIEEQNGVFTLTVAPLYRQTTAGGLKGTLMAQMTQVGGEPVLQVSVQGESLENNTGVRNLGIDLFRYWISELEKHAHSKGAKKLIVQHSVSSPSGENMMQRMGFTRTSLLPSGHSVWAWTLNLA